MFDMDRCSGNNDGYQLTITYRKANSKVDSKYRVTGYILGPSNRKSVDGKTQEFDSLLEALAYIGNYNHD